MPDRSHTTPRGNVKLCRASLPFKSRTNYSSACCRKIDKHSFNLAHAEVAIVARSARRSAVPAGGSCGLLGRIKLPKAAQVAQATLQQTTVQIPQDQDLELKEGFYLWKGHRIRYQSCGTEGPPVILIHGFGGNCDHWRKNTRELGKSCRAFAIDLLGYGFSDKPDPRGNEPNTIYNFEVWGKQIADFTREFIKEPTVLCCNSVGGLVGLQAARDSTDLIKAVQVLNISLRMLHLTKQSRIQRMYMAHLQKFLRTSNVGTAYFQAMAKPKAVKNILRECYGNKDAVDDELVHLISRPGSEPGAAQVFLDFISYSGGPLPEDLIENAPCPVSILWGDKDPWEKVEWGRALKDYLSVEEFVELPGVGHCPMDENPGLVNPLILGFIQRHLA